MDNHPLRPLERLLWLMLLVLCASCSSNDNAQGGGPVAQAPQATALVTPERTLPAPTLTLVATRTATPMPSATATITASPTASRTVTPTSSPTATQTATPTPWPTPDGVQRTARVPILMYHYVSEPPADADVYRRDLSVTPEQLDAHLAYLQDEGYHVVTLDDLLYALTLGRPLPEKPVILTFDDGYEDNYINAFPLLKKRGITATFFIVTDWVNQDRPGYMTWPQIEEMAAAGQRFGSHSRDHPSLAGQSLDYLVWQALGSKESIEEHLGYHPRWVAYPSGSYDEQTIAVFASADYWGGVTTQQGATHTLDDIFELTRVRVRGSHTAHDLGSLLQINW
jgi:peptidoglycan/xylan/chitin deacetylase (PgdA/CDA1 family)